ncbi:GIDE domain-containing protein [Petrachloros mirabilis]|nr:GIDE domain-containing protein [Nitrospira sp.]
MKCLDCQKDLIEIPTSHGPELDVCSSGHGLWLDGGEVNFFVEDYMSLKRAVGGTGSVAVRTQIQCPRCGNDMGPETTSETSFLSCDSCHGWWLPHGSLTRLNEIYRGAAVPIQFHETELYARAAARQTPIKESFCGQPKFHKPRTTPQGIWFWTLFFGIAFMIGGLILVAGIGKTMRTAHPWSRPPDQILLYLTLGIVGGVGLLIWGWLINQRKRLIESIPTSAIRSLALGLVEINGRAQPEEGLLASPFGGLPCVFYTYIVEERTGSDKHARWETIAKGTSEQPFFVRDETGRVLVVPLGATLILPDERASRHNWLGELPPTTVAGLNRLGISTEGWTGSRALRCRETFILPEERIYVLGTALEYHGARGLVENSSRMYIGSSRDHEFIISDRSEKELLSRLRWQASACFIGGLLLAAGCFITFLKRYLTTLS